MINDGDGAGTDGKGDIGETRHPRWVFGSGDEPDPRFTLANERTFLAWIRTSLSLIVAGVATKAFVHGAMGVTVSAALVSISVVVAGNSVVHWARSERALRLRRPLPAPALVPIMAAGVVVTAATVLAALVG